MDDPELGPGETELYNLIRLDFLLIASPKD